MLTFKKFGSLLIFIILLLFGKSLLSQTEFDSLSNLTKTASLSEKVLLYDQISKLYRNKNNDSVFYYANLSLKVAQEDKSDKSFGAAYRSLGDAYANNSDYSQALEYYLKSKEYCDKIENKSNQIKILSSIGRTYGNLNRFSNAIDTYLQALELAKETEDYNNESSILYHMAGIYISINDQNKALEYAIKSANVSISHGNEKDLADTYNLIGYIHMSLKNDDLAEDYFKKAHESYIKENNAAGLTVTYNNLGIIYNTKKDNQKAIEYYSQSLDYAKQLNDNEGISTAMNNIGMLYVEMGQIDKGLGYYFKSLEYSVKLYDKFGYTNTFNNIASAYLAAGNLQKAEETVYKALPLAKKLTDLAVIQESYQILSKISYQKGNYKKAFEFQGLQLAYNDSLYLQQKTSSIAEMQTRFETEAKEREIQLLKKDNEIKQLEFHRQRFLQRILIVISLLFLVIIIGTALSFRIINKSNKLLAQKNEELEDANQKLKESEKDLKELNATKDKLFSIIAHDLKNPFNALMGFSDLLDRNYPFLSEEERKEYIGVISESTQGLYKLLDNLLQWTRTQTGTISYVPEHFKLLPLIKQEADILMPNSDKKKISISINVEEGLTVFADKNTIGTVVRNLISNAIKFTSNGGWIEILAKTNDRFIEVSVTDSGVGIKGDDLDKIFMLDGSFTTKGTANESGTGLGLLLCKEFVEKNNGKIWVDSQKGKGSTFFFTLPVG